MDEGNYSISQSNDLKMKIVKENRVLTRSATKKSKINDVNEENKIITKSSKKRSKRLEQKDEFKKIKNDEINCSDVISDENSPLKLNNSSFNLDNQSIIESDLEQTKLGTSVFDKIDYEELKELPDEFDYKDVHLKNDVFIGYKEQKNVLHFLIKNSIQRGESGTVLIYGRSGSGKTLFVNTVLKESEFANNCKILRLSGLIHGNDASTIHQIAKFLDIQFTDLPRIMEKFKDECKKKIAKLIIVLDEFEVFCDKNQFLLYCFFDLMQYVGYIRLIGMTSRYDCIELLEKRVKSRMNHKIIDLKSPFQNLGEYLSFAKQLLDKDVPFTKTFQTNLEVQFSKSYSIAQLKTCLLFNMRSKAAIHKVHRSLNERYLLIGRDEKVSLICDYLTNLEICILLLAAKLVYLKELEYFNCNFLLNLVQEIPNQITCNQKLLFMAVSILIDYNLFLMAEKKSLQDRKLYLTEWTPLILNVFKPQIDESLKILVKKLPTGVAQLFSIQH